MTKSIILLLPVLVFAALTNRIGEAVYAADSGVTLGVTVINIGPPTINDFNYSALNITAPIADSGSTENTNIISPPDQTQQSADSGQVKGVSGNQNVNQAVTNDNQGIVKGATSEKPPSWFKILIDRIINFFKRIF